MIVFVSTASHRYTHAAVRKALPMFRQMTYPRLLTARTLPRATYIFSDVDQLGFWQLELAAHVYRALEAAGCRVLNDPARVLQRLALLKKLKREGVNSFCAWAADDPMAADRFPVFVRTASAHRGNLTALLNDRAALTASVDDLVGRGYPIKDLMIVEYRAEPLHADVFRKMSGYRVGDRVIPAPSVHERNWTAKYGEDGVAGEAAYEDDLEQVRHNPHGATVLKAFEAAFIEYGRADFGLVGGRPEVYEINTNPSILPPPVQRIRARAEAVALSHEAYNGAVQALDTVDVGRPVKIPPSPVLLRRRRRERLLPGYLWLP